MNRQQPSIRDAYVAYRRLRTHFGECSDSSLDPNRSWLPRNLPPAALGQVKGQTGVDFTGHDLLSPFSNQATELALMPFQEQGVAWLTETPRALLADEMGLGKTAQAIFALRDLIRNGEAYLPFLIVCPKSLLLTWMKEFRTWAPDLAISLLLPNRSAAEFVWRDRPMKAHGVVTSYEQLRQNGAVIREIEYSVVVCDEAHRLRKHTSGVHKQVRDLICERLWLLSGTPIERDSVDFLNLLSLLDSNRFSRRLSGTPASSLRAMAIPYVLRRERDAVLDQLPEHSVSEELVGLGEAQLMRYREILRGRNVNALSKLQSLLSICDVDPVTGESTKIDRLIEILAEVKDMRQKAIVFAHKLAPLHALKERLEQKDEGQEVFFLSGKTSLSQRESLIERWRADPNGVLLASLQVAGEGLTLVEANYVIFLNEWWNPSSNAQARDRVRRIGQRRPTFEILLRTANTVEERVYELLAEKELTTERVVGLLRDESERQSAIW